MKNAAAGLMLSIVAVATTHAQIPPAADAPPPYAPAESAARVQLPDGFHLELVASEPLIQDPSCLAFDERGQLFVCELHGYNVEGQLDIVELNKTGALDKQVRRLRWELMGGRIAEQARSLQYGVLKLLADTDGDGAMDRAEVWADDLPPCYGLLPARGGIIVVCAPDIVFLADRNGDGKPDIREILYTGFRTRVLERGINNPRWGLDNWIYVGAGGEGGTIRGPYLEKPVELSHGDFRIKPDGTAIQRVQGSVGTYGLTSNDIGDRFPCSGGRPAVYALPLPYHYLARNPDVPAPETNQLAATYSRGYRISSPHPWRVKRQQDPDWVKFYGARETDSGYFTGGCGGEIYRADRFPEIYRGNFFYCEPSLNVVHRCILQRDGAGYLGERAPGEEQSEFLASTDQWFRPINLRLGPDGALYIVDMYREIIEDYSAIPRFLQQQYGLMNGSDRGRIWRLVAGPPVKPPAVMPDALDTSELVALTGHANAWWRETAQRLLVERGDRSAAGPLSRQLRDGATPPARLHALYSLEGLDLLRASDVAHALGDKDYGVRLHALRAAEDLLENDTELFTAMIARRGDPDPRIRLQLALTLGVSRRTEAIETLLQLAIEHGSERWMPAAILSSATHSAGELLVGLLAAGRVDSPQSLLAPLATTLASRNDRLRWGPLLELLEAQEATVQVACLSGLADGIARRGRVLPVADNPTPLRRLLNSDSVQVRHQATRLASLLGRGDSPDVRAVIASAMGRALDPELSTLERQAAARLLEFAPYHAAEQSATRLLDARQPLELQRVAVDVLGAFSDEQVGAALLGNWRHLTPQLRDAVLAAILARRNRQPALLAAIERNLVRRGDLDAIQREQLVRDPDQQLAARAAELFAHPSAGTELQERVDHYAQALGDVRNLERGQEVFAKTCLPCHKHKDQGFEVGPPLGSVASKPEEAILLDILDPSGHIESEYGSYLVVTSQGQTFTGVLVSESATSVTLRKEKGADQVILRSDIETVEASDVSLMPSNLYEQISPEDMADLIGFLKAEQRP